jgi:hypothetical protein
MEPCDKGPEISKLQQIQREQDKKLDRHDYKLDQVLQNQIALGEDIKQAINGLTEIIKADVETRAAVEQGKKERAVLFEKVRSVEKSVGAINIRNAKCDGAGIFDEWPSIRKFVNQQKGLHRFIPTAAALVSTIIAILIGIDKLLN